MIRHSVILTLKESINSTQKETFFAAVNELKQIPNVQKFEVLRQISPKNSFEYGISMEFDNQAHYDGYSAHPKHQSFIQDFWIPTVKDFLEIDYVIR
jgi:hypothetical protein